MRVFKEIQRFNQWWIQLINLSQLALVGYLCYAWYFAEKAVDTVTPTNWIIQVVVFSTIGLTLLLLLSLRLKTEINESGIHYQFLPFHRTKKNIRWEEMSDCRIRKYNAIKEYGGWGYKVSFGNGKALNVKGNMGIQITLQNGKKLLIGTQKVEEAKQVIERHREKKYE